MAIAMRDSVTVSIAAEAIGMPNRMFLVNWEAVLTSDGTMWDSAGSSSTSSKVRPRGISITGL